MTIPATIRNQIESDIKACIVEEGEDPEKCIVMAARRHGLSREDAEELAESLIEEE